jgi:hypothetical protein
VPATLLHCIDSGCSPVQFTLDEIARAQALLALRPFQPLQKFSDNLRDEQLKIAVSWFSPVLFYYCNVGGPARTLAPLLPLRSLLSAFNSA